MNCKQAEKLLPLYAGRDLDEKRFRLVTAHLQTCAGCARVADEYRGASQLTEQFAPPAFSEDVYARIRRNVLNEIEPQSTTAPLSELFGGWFRPRIDWAVASALVVAFAVLAFYFVANRRAGNELIANHSDAAGRSEPGPTPGHAAPVIATTPSPGNLDSETPRVPKPKGWHPPRTSPLMAKTHESRTMKASPDQRESVEANPSQINNSVEERPLRVEIQTKDPNIRIIWFSQPATKPALPNSKGI